MNAQKIFNKAVGGVIRQGDLSIKGTKCSYRHPSKTGLACAVGQLIDDDTTDLWDSYGDSAIEFMPFDQIPASLDPKNNHSLLCDLQKAHDKAAQDHNDPAPRLIAFVGHAKRVAQRHSLKMKFTNQDVLEALS